MTNTTGTLIQRLAQIREQQGYRARSRKEDGLAALLEPYVVTEVDVLLPEQRDGQ